MLIKGLLNAMYDILCVDTILYYWVPTGAIIFDVGLDNFTNFLSFLEAKH